MQQQRISVFRAYGGFWKNYANFRGRTSKEAFWKALWLHSLFLLAGFSPWLYMYRSLIEFDDDIAALWVFPLVIYGLATLIPGIALIVRRLHDIDRHGAFILLFILVPIAGQIIFFIMLSRRSAPYDVFPGMSGSGPYDGRPRDSYARQPQAYGQPQSPYAQPQAYDPANPYGRQSPYAQPQNPYAPPQAYGQTQPYSQAQSPYAPQQQQYPPQYQSPYTPYTGQSYGQMAPFGYQRTLPPPRVYAPQAGGDKAAAFIVLTIIVYIASLVYGGVVGNYIADNAERYRDRYLEYYFDGYGLSPDYGELSPDYGEPSPDYGEDYPDYGPGDDWGYYDDYGAGAAPLTGEQQVIVDHVREGTLDGFPEFTIEQVLLSRADEYSLAWACSAHFGGGASEYAYSVTVVGYEKGGYGAIYASFDVYDDGRIELYNLMEGRRDEYGDAALELYKLWYDNVLLSDSNTTAA